ncbi:MAG: glycosyltransferase [Coprobacillus sp.]|nr:glycosyltransferase [Coprobacillus sp.]
MKVYIPETNTNRFVNFEGTRLLKTLKASLETCDVEYTSSVVDKFDVVHLISPLDDKKENDALERGIPVVVSAMFTESDPSCSFIEYKPHSTHEISVSNKTIHFLNESDLILVPSYQARNLLRESGVEKEIVVNPPGIDLSHFSRPAEGQKEVFYRYFREESYRDLVVAVGDYQTTDGMSVFLEVAREFPNILFYYFGPYSIDKASPKIRKTAQTSLKNVKFVGDVPDDVYESALLNAKIFLLPSYRPIGIVSLFEAIACRCQIIVRSQANLGGFLKEGKTAYLGEYSETLTSLCRDYLNQKISPTTEAAYEELSHYTLKSSGEQLKAIYQEVYNVHGFKGV